MSVHWSVGRLVGWLVSRSFDALFGVFELCELASSLLLLKCPSDLLYHSSYPPARDWGCRVHVYLFLKYDRSLLGMKVGQHYYSTLLYLRMRAFGALTGV